MSSFAMSFDPRNLETFISPTNSKFFLLSNKFEQVVNVMISAVATIKYWGKGDVKLNTPMNSSASVTLDQVIYKIMRWFPLLTSSLVTE